MSEEMPAESTAAERGIEELELRKRIALGFDVENFLLSPVGRYLTERAEAEREALLEQLALIDHTKADQIHRIQTRIAVLDHWQEGLAEATTDGNQAQLQLVEQLG